MNRLSKIGTFSGLFLFGVLAFHGESQLQAQSQNTGSISLVNSVVAHDATGDLANMAVNFALYKDGVAVEGASLSSEPYALFDHSQVMPDCRVTWKGLAPGSYELWCEAVGYGKLTTRLGVGKGETKFSVTELPKKDEIQGADPTYFTLKRRVAELKKENAALKARLAALEKAK